MKSSKPKPAENQSDIAAADLPVLLDSQQQPAWHVVVLSFFTLGAYNMYWLYRNLNSLCQGSNQLQRSINGEDPDQNWKARTSDLVAREPLRPI